MTQQTVAETGALSLSLDRYPGMGRFALDLVRGEGKAAALLQRPAAPTRPGTRREPSPELVAALRESNLRWNNDVAAELEEWRSGRSLCLIAGQQVGFGGGPLYTLAKIASLLSLREALEKKGQKATVFFWMATEDHDFAEAAKLEVPAGDSIERLTARADDRPRPVGSTPLPQSLLDGFRKRFPAEVDADWLESGLTFGESFARLMARVLRGHRVVLVDSMLPALRREAKPLVQEVFRRWPELQATVRERSEVILASGYRPQIDPTDNGEYAFLFLIEKGERHPLRHDQRWVVGEHPRSHHDLAHLIAEHPEQLSTAAMIRPLMQDFVFGTDIFVGGPAEVSYYAQVLGLHEALGVRPPYVALRGHALVAPLRIFEFIEKHAIRPGELFVDTEELLLERESSSERELDQMLSNLSSDLERGVREIASVVVTADRGLQKSIERTMRHLRYHIGKLSERGRKAIARSDLVRYQQMTRVRETLAPGGSPQDRHVGWLPFYLQHGERLLDRLVAEIRPDSDELQIIGL
jgi:bacillithiol biosynthesis cysteine-adding enzyme BshC